MGRRRCGGVVGPAPPQAGVEPQRLREEEAANVERADHVPVPHPMPVPVRRTLVRVARIVAELGLVVVGAPARPGAGLRAAPVRAEAGAPGRPLHLQSAIYGRPLLSA